MTVHKNKRKRNNVRMKLAWLLAERCPVVGSAKEHASFLRTVIDILSFLCLQ